MNIEFQKALQYIDKEAYEKAIESLNIAITQEEEADNLSTATEYRCVLGELYYQLQMDAQALDELGEVIRYCDETNTLTKQREIARTYINAINGILPQEIKDKAEAAAKADAQAKRSKSMPLVPKPVQDKAFITKQMSKKRR